MCIKVKVCTLAVVNLSAGAASLSSASIGLKQPTYRLRKFNEKGPLKVKNFPEGRRAILDNLRRRCGGKPRAADREQAAF
jgi:hypothetical protein